MTSADYITINDKGVFVKGKPVTEYRGQYIEYVEDLPWQFLRTKKDIKGMLHLDLEEVHALSSAAPCLYGEPGVASCGEDGCYAWVRIKLADGRVSPWVGMGGFHFVLAGSCARYCASECIRKIAIEHRVRQAVFGSFVKPKETREKSDAQKNEKQRPMILKVKNLIIELKNDIKSIKR